MNIEAFSTALVRYRNTLALREELRESGVLSGDFALDEVDLSAFGQKLASVTDGVRTRVSKLVTELNKYWSRSPLLENGSLFKPLGLQSKEVPLTRALAWWFGCGRQQTILTRDSLAALLSLIDISAEGSSLRQWRVTAEEPVIGNLGKGRLDILLSGPIGPDKYCIAIEAKVNAREGERQLEKYARALSKAYSGFEVRLVLLTVAGAAPKSHPNASEGVHALRFQALLDVLLPVLRRFEEQAECREEVEFGRLMWADIARLCSVHVGKELDGGDIFQLEHIINAQLNAKGSTNE